MIFFNLVMPGSSEVRTVEHTVEHTVVHTVEVPLSNKVGFVHVVSLVRMFQYQHRLEMRL